MNSMRLASPNSVFPLLPCCRCGREQRPWDRIAGKSYCPSCLEAMALGEADPVIEHTENHYCAVCHRQGTLRFLTFPLQSRRPVEIDLCGEHLRSLVARHLGPFAFEKLRQQLSGLRLAVTEVFLLHEAFYDQRGRALQPASAWM